MDRDLELIIIGELKQSAAVRRPDPLEFGGGGAGRVHGYAGLYVLNGRGDILARGETAEAPPYLAPPPPEKVFAGNANEFVLSSITAGPGRRARAVSPERLRRRLPLCRAPAEPRHRRTAAQRRRRHRRLYRAQPSTAPRCRAPSPWRFGETGAAGGRGRRLARHGRRGAVASPVARLVQAADRVAAGDLTVRVETDRGV